MKLRSRSREPALRDRLVWQAASLLLAYPDDGLTERLDTVEGLLAHLDGTVAELLGRTVAALRAAEPMAAAMDYVLEFAATVAPEVGRRLLTEHRIPIDVLRSALADAESPYQHTVAAVCETLPAATDQEVRRARRLARQLYEAGPPAEAVGLQPFTLTVPPRRQERGPDV